MDTNFNIFLCFFALDFYFISFTLISWYLWIVIILFMIIKLMIVIAAFVAFCFLFPSFFAIFSLYNKMDCLSLSLETTGTIFLWFKLNEKRTRKVLLIIFLKRRKEIFFGGIDYILLFCYLSSSRSLEDYLLPSIHYLGIICVYDASKWNDQDRTNRLPIWIKQTIKIHYFLFLIFVDFWSYFILLNCCHLISLVWLLSVGLICLLSRYSFFFFFCLRRNPSNPSKNNFPIHRLVDLIDWVFVLF